MSLQLAAAERSRQYLIAEISRVLAHLESAAATYDGSFASSEAAPTRPPGSSAQPSADNGSGRRSPALMALVEALRLSAFERDLLLLCVAAEIDARANDLCARLQPAQPYPTFALALATLDEPHWSAIGPSSPLRHWRLLHIVGDSGALAHRRLRADERVVHHLIGLDYLDPELAPFVRPLSGRGVDAPDTWLVKRLRGLLDDGPVVLAGDDAGKKRALAAALAAETGRPAFSVRSEEIPVSPQERAVLARLWEREVAFTGTLLLVDCDDNIAFAAAFAEELRAPVLLAVPEAPIGLERPHGRIEVNRPRWQISGTDRSRASRVAVGDLAQRIEPLATWDDIVLPPHQLQTLREVGLHVRYADRVYREWGMARKSSRGLGISALFAGASGTGKTMAAEVLANDLGLDLYRIDLSTVVSKYVGETEKNLRRVFDAAEDAGVILLFDEADALFGKRSEVRDSHDRYANIEVSYLLQRMESYAGLAILTTNLKQALDPAFLRRLRFVVQFPFPDASQRAEIWRRTFPELLPRYELDVHRLSQLNVAGGNIRNIALNAAFLAASNGGAVTMAHLLQASRGEYAKLEKPLSEAEIRGWT
jgi:ATP-dependent 26S proteasome regulatory subunit